MSNRRKHPAPSGPGRREAFEGFHSRSLDNHRTVTVYLPPGYDADAQRRYPVVYLHDGQNLFDPARARSASPGTPTPRRSGSSSPDASHRCFWWASTTRPTASTNTPITPTEASAGGRGSLYARFVLNEVKVFIDTRYRTLPDRRHTAVIGSSMGGLISLSMAREHHKRFSLCGAVSASLWWGGGRVLEDFEAETGWMRRMRFWLDMGTREGPGRGHVPPSIGRTRRLAACFDAAGLIPGRDYLYWEVAGGEHNEAAWAGAVRQDVAVFLRAVSGFRARGRREPFRVRRAVGGPAFVGPLLVGGVQRRLAGIVIAKAQHMPAVPVGLFQGGL